MNYQKMKTTSGPRVCIHNGMDLLEFKGNKGNYRAFGTFLAKRILANEDDRVKFCLSPRQIHSNVRKRAPADGKKAFKGIGFG